MELPQVVHLRAFSEYSLLYSSARLEQLAQAATGVGMKALGVTDCGGMYGAVSLYSTFMQAGVQPVMGQTLRVAHPYVKDEGKRTATFWDLVLIAESERGYQSLCELSTLAALDHRDEVPFNTWDEIATHHAGLICLTGGQNGPLGRAVTSGDQKLTMVAEPLLEVFGRDHLYVELICNGVQDEQTVNQALYDFAREAHIPVVGTTLIRHIHPQDVRTIDILKGIEAGCSLSVAAEMRPRGASYHFRSQMEMQELFRNFPGAIEATMEIAQRGQFELHLHALQLPSFPLEEGQSESMVLRELAEKGLRDRVADPRLDYIERLQFELNVVEKMGFSGYFLIVWDFVHFAHEHGISTGPGRGSAAGSLVAYCLRITDVDPLEYHLLFERFLNPERVSWPDIDIDFETERRYEVIAYVAQKYGFDRVAQIGTLGTFAARAAIRDVGRVLQVPLKQVDELARKIPSGPGVTISSALKDSGDLRDLVSKSPNLSRLIELARGIEGLPRHPSVHAAGVVIASQPLSLRVPLMEGAEGIAVTQYDMGGIETLGLLKMDFLGLRTLTICDRAVVNVQKVRGIHLHYEDMQMDEATRELLAAGDTDGCFQLESSGVKQVLRELQPTVLDDLIAVISLYRPGPMEQIGAFIRGRRGETAITYVVPELESILSSTYGILVYQEQIMQIAAVMAGFSLGEADILRRAVSKKKRETLDQARADFVVGCLRNGHDQAKADAVYDLIVRFADYGFNRSHAAAYAVVALRTAYLKANYRAEFMASLITDSVSRPDKVAQYALSCRRAGITVHGPDIAFSLAECAPVQEVDGSIGIRLGLYSIKNVGTAAVESVLQQRDAGGPFHSLADFLTRVDHRVVSRRVLENLIQVGAFDGWQISRNELLRRIRSMVDKKGRTGNQLSIPGVGEPDFVPLDTLRSQAPMQVDEASIEDRAEMDAWERDLIGFVASHDAFSEIKKWQLQLQTNSIGAWKQQLEGRLQSGNIHFVAKVTDVKKVRTKKGESMAFIRLEDHDAAVDLVVFPSAFRLLQETPDPEQLWDVVARPDPGNDGNWIAVKLRLLPLSPQPAREGLEVTASHTGRDDLSSVHTLYIRITRDAEADRSRMDALREVLKAHVGPLPVVLVYATGHMRSLDTLPVTGSETLYRRIRQLLGQDSIRLK